MFFPFIRADTQKLEETMNMKRKAKVKAPVNQEQQWCQFVCHCVVQCRVQSCKLQSSAVMFGFIFKLYLNTAGVALNNNNIISLYTQLIIISKKKKTINRNNFLNKTIKLDVCI